MAKSSKTAIDPRAYVFSTVKTLIPVVAAGSMRSSPFSRHHFVGERAALPRCALLARPVFLLPPACLPYSTDRKPVTFPDVMASMRRARGTYGPPTLGVDLPCLLTFVNLCLFPEIRVSDCHGGNSAKTIPTHCAVHLLPSTQCSGREGGRGVSFATQHFRHPLDA